MSIASWRFSRQYDRKFTPGYTTSRATSFPGSLILVLVNAAANQIPTGNSIYQTHVSRFSVRNGTFKTTDEFSPLLFRFTISRVPLTLHSPVPRQRPFYDVASPFRTNSRITTFPRIFIISRNINSILWKKYLLLRINIATKALPPSHFESCAL